MLKLQVDDAAEEGLACRMSSKVSSWVEDETKISIEEAAAKFLGFSN